MDSAAGRVPKTWVAAPFGDALCQFHTVDDTMRMEWAASTVVVDPDFWTYRPLSEQMVRAAADDVRFLLHIYHKMMEKMNERTLWQLAVRGALYCRCFCINDNDYVDWPTIPQMPAELQRISTLEASIGELKVEVQCLMQHIKSMCPQRCLSASRVGRIGEDIDQVNQIQPNLLDLGTQMKDRGVGRSNPAMFGIGKPFGLTTIFVICVDVSSKSVLRLTFNKKLLLSVVVVLPKVVPMGSCVNKVASLPWPPPHSSR
ncbi:hypothetical protein Syun_026285 [Stephania yunnanensis]|uniref:Uncharacterized protein n=1 Tax=Stephania yunnanensis TaxID=152371 RepID=A0AAP0HWV8_9MAGN